MNKASVIIIIIITSLALISVISYKYYSHTKENENIQTVWNHYKNTFIIKDGRVIDPQRNNITTSEGQSYALLRSIMMDDKETFDKVYGWTIKNLKRDNDNLFSWLWDEKVKDANSATDADIDIAYALIIASKKWENPQYLEIAKLLIKDIYKYETKVVNTIRVLMPGVEQTKSDIIEVNPSYFAPYAFRAFYKLDKENDWMALVNSSYYLSAKAMSKTETGLLPNWFKLDESANVIIDKDSDRSDFSYDSIRTFLRFYLDKSIYNEIRAESILVKSRIFADRWSKDKKFYTNYKADAEIRNEVEYIGSIALMLPIINEYNTKLANDVYNAKIRQEYKQFGGWQDGKNYYAHNLIWFGLSFFKHKKELIDYLTKI